MPVDNNRHWFLSMGRGLARGDNSFSAGAYPPFALQRYSIRTTEQKFLEKIPTLRVVFFPTLLLHVCSTGWRYTAA